MTAPAAIAESVRRHHRRYVRAFAGLCVAMPMVALVAAGMGAYHIDPWDVPGEIFSDGIGASVLINIRWPRVVLALAVGASLAIAGAVMQGLFRNPLADPGLIGVTSGAALGAATWIVIFSRGSMLGTYGVSLAAFVAGLLVVALIWRIAQRDGRLAVVTLLLAGIAINSIAGAGIGVLTFVADDQQLRALTFWMLGGMQNVTWRTVIATVPVMAVGVAMLLPMGRALNALALGEADAFYLGTNVERVKRRTIVGVALTVGAAVSAAGGIGFIGLVVPHALRIGVGADHRWLLPNAILSGAMLLALADLVARTAVSPAEMPVGIVTSMLGGPFFLWLLLSRRREVLRA